MLPTGKPEQVPSGHHAGVNRAGGLGQWLMERFGFGTKYFEGSDRWQVASGIKLENLVLLESAVCCEVCRIPGYKHLSPFVKKQSGEQKGQNNSIINDYNLL